MDPFRDPFLRRQVLSQAAMALAPSLPSGQAYYTLESLEGATSVPFFKPAPPASLPRRESFPPSLPVPLDCDALLRLDAQTRASLADREAEREALLRNLPGGATALPDQRMYADRLQALDARARVSLDGLHNLDPRARALLDNARVLSHGLDVRPGAPLSGNRGISHGLDARALLDNGSVLSHGLDVCPGAPLSGNRGISHGFDARPCDPLHPGVGTTSRARSVVGGIAPGATEHGPLSELLHARELGVGAPFLPLTDTGRRDIGWAEVLDVGAHSARLFANGDREPAAMRAGPAEANIVKQQAERNKGLSNSKPSPAAAKIKPPPEQSEGWCGVCKIDCLSIKTLGTHVNGKKHKAAVEQLQGNKVKVEETSKTVDKQVISAPATSQADKKRASDKKPETLQSAKHLKASTPVVTSNAPMAVATDNNEAKATATKVISNPSHQFCEICNISTTGKMNLEAHLKGKLHAARVRRNLKILRKNLRILSSWSQPPSFCGGT